MYASSEEAGAAYEAARKRARLGEPIPPSAIVKPSIDDFRRWYRPPSQEIKFGDREGEAIIAVDPDQERSIFLLHNALNDLHPKVKKFVLLASRTGELTEAALAAGLSQADVAAVLPQLKVYLRRHLY